MFFSFAEKEWIFALFKSFEKGGFLHFPVRLEFEGFPIKLRDKLLKVCCFLSFAKMNKILASFLREGSLLNFRVEG